MQLDCQVISNHPFVTEVFLGNIYFNSIILGFCELCGNLISIPVVKYIGVKRTGIMFNLIAGVALTVTAILLEIDPKR